MNIKQHIFVATPLLTHAQSFNIFYSGCNYIQHSSVSRGTGNSDIILVQVVGARGDFVSIIEILHSSRFSFKYDSMHAHSKIIVIYKMCAILFSANKLEFIEIFNDCRIAL